MMVSFPFLSQTIDFNNSSIQILSIENVILFRDTIESLISGNLNKEIVFSNNYEPFDYSKNVILITNPLFPEVSERKIMLKAEKDLEQIINNNYYEEFSKAAMILNNLGVKLCEDFEFDFTYNSSISPASLIKLLSFTPNIGNDVTCLERLLLFTRLYNKYLATKCFVVVNLSLYFSLEEIKELYETFLLDNICLLDIENQYSKKIGVEGVRVVDKDMCEIIDI